MAKARGRARRGKKGAVRQRKKDRAAKKAEAPVRRAAQIKEAVPAVCSECYGDFFISTSPSENTVKCPVCGHVGIVEEGIFQEIERRTQERRKNFLLACIVTVGAFVSVLLYALLNSWPLAVNKTAAGTYTFTPADENVNMALLGLGLLLLVASFVVIPRYERSRFEVYF